MSDETARKLEEARTQASQRSAEADRRKHEFLVAIARGIPPRVENLAKRTAHAQADVSKALGRDGVQKFRAELHKRATELANEVEAAVDLIKWPNPQGDYSSVTSRSLHKALFDFLYGRRVGNLAVIFKSHGFDVQEIDGSQGLILPQSLYSEQEQATEFAAIAEALNALSVAERAVKQAEAAHDRDVVDSLWEGQ